ncbi:ArnT family glycosyltransferase [Candidatus Latescibacterota bacterium]
MPKTPGILVRTKTILTKIWQGKFGIPLFLLFAVWLSFFYNLGDVPLTDRDEGAFSEATREMFERNDYISTYLNGEPRYDKPILIYWFQALGVLLFGICELAFRLPSALFASFWVFSVYFFTREQVDRETGWVAAIITATSLLVTVIGRAATADALLNLLIALSMFDIYRYYKESRNIFIYRTFMWIGLGILTKGPVALIIPVVTSFVFFFLRKQRERWIKAVFNPAGILILLVITLPWYIIQYFKEGQAFIDGFFLKHNVGRFNAPMEGHAGELFYYIPVILLAVLPYTGLLIRSLGRLKGFWKKEFDLFLWIWFFFVFIFFSFSGTKLPHYILYGSVPLFILMANYRKGLRFRKLVLVPGLLLFLLILFLPEITEQIRLYGTDDYITAMLGDTQGVFNFGYRFWSVIAVTSLLILMFTRFLDVWRSLIVAGFITVFIVTHVLMPAVGAVMQEPVKEAALFAKEKGYSVVVWGVDHPSFSVYRQKVTPRRKPLEGDIVLTKVTRLKRLGKYELLFQKGAIVLAHVKETVE